MNTTTDFELWIAENEPESFDEVNCLYEATFGESSGIYNATSKNGKVFISVSGAEHSLALLSVKAVEAFRKKIEVYNVHRDLGWEGAAALVRAMQKDD